MLLCIKACYVKFKFYKSTLKTNMSMLSILSFSKDCDAYTVCLDCSTKSKHTKFLRFQNCRIHIN
ncbi:hypothetical protein RO3G_06712 [Rhizopus delemar RA 99-880]|uniref:Uncharacterized protein n=1 Tax=Rhizopus delemar (strain RA 99-880 / ATCC MYA-4621 / FGSC 9543 / NRRL 43880) TaxID=246409 RepID=I1C0M7_RHIO9|nr:hypothetical protein RO3G_06712 [Rhizopus delemar RA 99-880]|eukprot:EIE82007.1 hypothetical protein RO3G_06712 [Rhizopus delemar RA 99-880]